MGDGAKRAFDDAGDGVKDFKGEAAQTAKETAASFDGSAESIGSSFQEVAANAFSGFGPAGTAAGVAVAAGLGVAIDAFTKVNEAAEEARDSAYKFAYDVGGALDAAGYSDRIEQWTGDTEKLKAAQEIATIAGQDIVPTLDALASGGDKLDALWDAFERGTASTTIASTRAAELEATLKGTKDGYLSGAEGAELAALSNYNYATSVGTATGETDELGNAIMRLPDGKEFVVNAQTQTAYDNLDAIDQRQIGEKTFRMRGILDTTAIDNYVPGTKVFTVKGLIDRGTPLQ
jgi:hypothetical protein